MRGLRWGSARVTAMDAPRTIHDFGAFPQALFDVRYPAPGSPALAERVAALLAPLPVTLDQRWGLDHGAWSVLVHAFPQADIPVVQLSIDATRPHDYHHAIGRLLQPLRDEGVLIMGSGNVVHNLPAMDWHDPAAAYDWAQRFQDVVQAAIAADDPAPLIAFEAQGADAKRSIPSPDHYLPLLYIAGLADDRPLDLLVDGHVAGSISMAAYTLGLDRTPGIDPDGYETPGFDSRGAASAGDASPLPDMPMTESNV